VREGYLVVDVASTVDGAVRRAAAARRDVVLIDVELGVGCGFGDSG
jgi:AmiR/NasT family two-component response regulator